MMFKKLTCRSRHRGEHEAVSVPPLRQPTDLFGHGGAQARPHATMCRSRRDPCTSASRSGDSGRPVVADAPDTPEARLHASARNLAAQSAWLAYNQQEAKRGAPMAFFTKK